MQKLDIIKQVLGRAKRWRCPPQWQPDQWREELIAVAWAALWEGLNNGIKSENGLKQFVAAAVMKRYRDEWNYGVRWVQPNQQQEEDNEGDNGWDLWDWVESEVEAQEDEQEINFMRIVIRQALAQLSEEDRYIVERRFWDGATERELAKELGISQPAVHKRITQIIKRLRSILE